MAINNVTQDSNGYYGVVDENSTHEPFNAFFKHLVEKVNEGISKTNEHETATAKQTVTGFDNIAFSVDSKLTTLTITVTSGKTTKIATLSFK
jgi:hypothetical protein